MGQGKSRLRQTIHNRAIKLAEMKALRLDRENMDVNSFLTTEDYDNVTPIWLAVRYNDVDLAVLLIQAGANPNIPCGELLLTPLHVAAYNHNVDMIRHLLANGANPDIRDRWNYTPLMYCAIYYEPFTVMQLFQVFIEYGCDVNCGVTVDEKGDTTFATQTDLPDIRSQYDGWYITYMREPLGPTSGTAIHLAVQNPHLPDSCLEVLIHAGADVNRRNLYGQTPIVGAILDTFYDYHTNIKSHAQLLITHGADVNIPDIRGWTPLHYSSQRGSILCMHLLISAGADSNLHGHQSESPLWLLLAHGWQETAKFLIMNGCDINESITSSTILSLNQNTDICRYGEVLPIEFALCNRYYDIAELLVMCGCKMNERTWIGNRHISARHNEFLNFLDDFKKQSKKVSSLKNVCRNSIRSHIQQGICIKVDQVQLPHSLKEFICYKA